MPYRILLKSDCIEIYAQRGDEEIHKLLAPIYPVHKNRIGTLFKVSRRRIFDVLEIFRGITQDTIATAPDAIQAHYYAERDRMTSMQYLLQGITQDSPVVNTYLTLEPHQQVAREIARVINSYGFFYDTRTGKTPLSLAIMYDDIMNNPDHKWLVVCPLILIENAWLEDAAKFVPMLKTINCHATTKAKRLKAMAQAGNIYIANTESFAKYLDYYKEIGFYGCIVDESSDMKRPSSAQSIALISFSTLVTKWFLLSGTPAPNGEWEYYAQLKSIDEFCMPSSFSQFKERYFINISHDSQYENLIIRPDRKDELYAILKENSLYVDKEDVLNTPGRDFIEVEYELPAVLKRAYNDMKNKLVIEMSDSTLITAPSAAAKLNKLNQITSGFVIDTDAVKENKFNEIKKTEIHLLDSTRFELLYDLLGKQGSEQILIWANYREEFYRIKEALGERCACVFGETSLQAKTQAIRDFKEGRIQYLVANPASADKGLTLTNAHICIYFSLNWSYELFKQSMERIYADIKRQPHKCMYYILIASKTIDAVLYREVLQGKAAASYTVLNHLKGGSI